MQIEPCLKVLNKVAVGTHFCCSIYNQPCCAWPSAVRHLPRVLQGAVDEEKVEALKREAEAVMGDK